MFGALKRIFDRSLSHDEQPVGPQSVVGSSLDDSFDAIRQTQLLPQTGASGGDARRTAVVSGKAAVEAVKPTHRRRSRDAKMPIVNQGTKLYAPLLRPPMAFLAAFDDGSIDDAEMFRLRGGTHVIGRDQGDICIPHEVMMSSRHAQIQCRKEPDGYHWFFQDLDSRNGSFFRVQRAILRQGQEFLLGAVRLAICLPDSTIPDSVDPNEEDFRQTKFIDPTAAASLPRLAWRDHRGKEQSRQVSSTHVVLGSDAATSAIGLTDEPYVCPNHAKLYKTDKGWVLEDLGSRNGTWLRMASAKLDQLTEFQLGEQRFYFRPR